MSRGAWFSVVIVVAAAFGLLSLAYPSVATSNVSIRPISSHATYTSLYAINYSEISASTFLAGYSPFTAWYPGNPICDPMSNACTPYPTPTATFTYPQSGTYTYEMTLTTQTTSTYTYQFTSLSSQTNFQDISPYAALGLTDFQFGIGAITTIAVIGLIVLYFNLRREPTVIREKPSAKLDSARPIMFCYRCGARNYRTDRFCTQCGTQLD